MAVNRRKSKSTTTLATAPPLRPRRTRGGVGAEARKRVRNLVQLDDLLVSSLGVWVGRLVVNSQARARVLTGDEISPEALMGVVKQFDAEVIPCAMEWLATRYPSFDAVASAFQPDLCIYRPVGRRPTVVASIRLAPYTRLPQLDSIVIRLWDKDAHEYIGIDQSSTSLSWSAKASDPPTLWFGPTRLLRFGCEKCYNVTFVNSLGIVDHALDNDVHPLKALQMQTCRQVLQGDELWLDRCGTYPSECHCAEDEAKAEARKGARISAQPEEQGSPRRRTRRTAAAVCGRSLSPHLSPADHASSSQPPLSQPLSFQPTSSRPSSSPQSSLQVSGPPASTSQASAHPILGLAPQAPWLQVPSPEPESIRYPTDDLPDTGSSPPRPSSSASQAPAGGLELHVATAERQEGVMDAEGEDDPDYPPHSGAEPRSSHNPLPQAAAALSPAGAHPHSNRRSTSSSLDGAAVDLYLDAISDEAPVNLSTHEYGGDGTTEGTSGKSELEEDRPGRARPGRGNPAVLHTTPNAKVAPKRPAESPLSIAKRKVHGP